MFSGHQKQIVLNNSKIVSFAITVHAAYTGTIGTRQKCRYKRRAGISGAHC